jgi:hypothetical protein
MTVPNTLAFFSNDDGADAAPGLLLPEEKSFVIPVEVIDSAELAKRLNVPETWVRSRTNPRSTRDSIPHLRFGRYVRFPWGSEELRKWLDRQLVSANGRDHSFFSQFAAICCNLHYVFTTLGRPPAW